MIVLSKTPFESEVGTVITDSCDYIRGRTNYRCHLVLSYEDLTYLLEDEQSTWYVHYYKSNFYILLAIIFLGRVLNKELRIYARHLDSFKELLKSSNSRIQDFIFLD